MSRDDSKNTPLENVRCRVGDARPVAKMTPLNEGRKPGAMTQMNSNSPNTGAEERGRHPGTMTPVRPQPQPQQPAQTPSSGEPLKK